MNSVVSAPPFSYVGKNTYRNDVSLHEFNKKTTRLRVIMQRMVVISYGRLEETYGYKLQGSRLQLSRNVSKKLPLLAAQ
jgi:hypothetical protein